MHGHHQHSNLGVAQVEQELTCYLSSELFSWSRAIGAAPCSLAHCVGSLLRFIALYHSPTYSVLTESGRETKQRNIPSEKWHFSFACYDCHHLCFHSATIDSARLVVKGRFPCIVPLSWHAREGQESDCGSFHGSLCPNQPLKIPSRSFC